MFSFRSKTYDIQASRKGRWTIEQTASDQASAEAMAKALLSKLKDIEGVRVVLDSKPDQVLFEQKKPQVIAPLSVPQIDEAPLCATRDDLYAAASRKTLNRLFRQYLDKTTLTPSEIMHIGREMKRLNDFESIVQTAIDRAARVQKGPEGEDAKKRTDALWKIAESVTKRANEADKLKLPSIRETGFDAAIQAVAKTAKPEELTFLLRCTVARELSQSRSWYGKLTQAMEWSKASEEPASMPLLDDFISDTLGSATILTDLLGQQPSLADALNKLLDMATGRFKGPSKGQSAEVTAIEELLCKLMATGKLPASQDILMERVRAELRGNSPLIRNNQIVEQERFRELIRRVLHEDGVLGGSGMAESLVHRAAAVLEIGGPNGLRSGVGWVVAAGPSPLANAHFVVALSGTRIATALEAVLASELKTQIAGISDQAARARILMQLDQRMKAAKAG
jgi:hypothetical protein